MRKTTILAVLLAISIVNAATITLEPSTIYETTNKWLTIDIDNYNGSTLITKVELLSTTLNITDAMPYTGWTTTYDNDSAEWKDGLLPANVKSAYFEYKTSAPIVTTNTTNALIIEINDVPTTINLTVLNDDTPPVITSITPAGYVLANNPTQTINLTIIDAETSVASATFKYNNCAGGADTTITLTKTGDYFTGTANFSTYSEGTKVCYTITATNAPGETSTTTGELQFDGTAPTVTLNAPTTYATEQTTFSLTATDNIATTMTCQIKLGTTTLTTINATNATQTNTTLNLTGQTQGSTSWSATCADGVGLTDEETLSIIVDTEAPTITQKDTPTLLRTQDDTFTVEVTDAVEVNTVNATFDGDIITLTQNANDHTGTINSDDLGNKTLTITATDKAGHTTTKTITITTVQNHQLTLTLNPSTTTEGTIITASGTLTPDGNTTSTQVTIKTPTTDITADLISNDYSATFAATTPGTYTITTEYVDAGNTYAVEATLTIQAPGTSSSSSGSNGFGSNWQGAQPQQETTQTEQQEETTTEQQPEQTEETPQQTEYEPLPAEEPRSALTPSATGIFNLGKHIKWIAPTLMIAIIGALGAYAYTKRKPKDDADGIDWDGYFRNG